MARHHDPGQRSHIEKNLREVKEICEYFLGIDPVTELDSRSPHPALLHGRRTHQRQRGKPGAQRLVLRGRRRLLGHARLQPLGWQLGGRDRRVRHDRGRVRGRLLRERPGRHPNRDGAFVRGAGSGQDQPDRRPFRRRGSLRAEGRDATHYDGEGRHLPHGGRTAEGGRRAARAGPAQPQRRRAKQGAARQPRARRGAPRTQDDQAGHVRGQRRAGAHGEPRGTRARGLSGAQRPRLAQPHAGGVEERERRRSHAGVRAARRHEDGEHQI